MTTATEFRIDYRLLDLLNWQLIEYQLRKIKQEEESGKSQKLCCSHCRLIITREDQRIPVQGKHEHVYSNPNGIVFHIGCFASAPGCQSVGISTEEWTWFRGFTWQIAICKGCGEHLGWRYRRSDGDIFYGLLVNRLEPASDLQA
jgi:hypothetical protein